MGSFSSLDVNMDSQDGQMTLESEEKWEPDADQQQNADENEQMNDENVDPNKVVSKNQRQAQTSNQQVLGTV